MKTIIRFTASVLLFMFLLCFENMSVSAQNDTQPFSPGTFKTEKFRIPAAYTLNDGRLLFAADMRNVNGSDSPQNIDTLLSFYDGESYEYNVVNHFDDVALGTEEKESASFIDSALLQSGQSGRIFIITTAYPTGTGILNGEKGSGMLNGKLRLFDGSGNEYCVGEYDNGYAQISCSGYSIDEEFNLYKDSKPLLCKQKGSEKSVFQNVFFSSSDLHVLPTSYLIMRYSDDGGSSWSSPIILNYLKKDKESFMGICPGRGTIVEADGKERLLFCVYNHSRTGREKASVIFSDDNGLTWKRSADLKNSLLSGKSSESQIINCPDGSLRIFSRNKSRFITTARSFDGGETLTKLKADTNLYCTKNCMVSFINTSKIIDGKQVVLGSFPQGGKSRCDGVIVTGLMAENGDIDWTKKYHINKGFFAYSCLTEMRDGKVACLYEDEPAGISLGIFEITDDGTLFSVNGDDIVYQEEDSLALKALKFLNSLLTI